MIDHNGEPVYSSHAQGVHGSGGRAFSAAQYQRVVHVLQQYPDRSWKVADLTDATGVPGRTVREIVSQADGAAFVLGGDATKGYRLAVNAEDALRATLRLASQAQRMTERVRRRDALSRKMWKEANNAQLPLIEV